MKSNVALNLDELEKVAYIGDKVVMKNLDIGRLPFHNVDIYFNDDIWDFKKTTSKTGKEKDQYNFSDIHYEYKIYVKQLILKYIINSSSVSTTKKYLLYYKKITKFLEENYIYDCELITESTINKFNEFLSINLKTENERIHNRRLFTDLLSSIEYYRELDYTNLKSILAKRDSALLKAQIEDGKTPSIPNHIFDKILSCALSELNDENTPENYKKEACAVILMSQIGMRILELSLLESNNKKDTDCFNGEKVLSYLEFKTYKTTKGNKGKVTKTFLTEYAELAYSTLEKLTKDDRKRYNTSYLFISASSDPVDTATVTNMMDRFMARNANGIGLINANYEGFKTITKKSNDKYKKLNTKYFEILSDTDFISVPKPHQFRVAVCNKLINEGVEIGWIVEHMNHLNTEMTKHYIRENDENIEQKNLTKEVFKGLLSGEFKLIGEEADLLVNKINEFVEKNNYNIKDNLEEIIDSLSGQIPIREKREGYCIKSLFGKKCKYNEFICAFEMCPNHCTSYLFADISYNRFLKHRKLIMYNENNGFISEAKVERNKLKRMVTSYLIQELYELRNEISSRGGSILIEKYSNLAHLVKNIENIIKEVELWIEKN